MGQSVLCHENQRTPFIPLNGGDDNKLGMSVLLMPDATTYPDTTMVAVVEDAGHVNLLGYDKGDDYEWGVTVDRSHKDLLLFFLIRHSFHSDTTFCAWLQGMGIPYKVTEPAGRYYDKGDDYEWGVTVDPSHKDLLLLFLIRHSFRSDMTFCAWLQERGIPYKAIEPVGW